MRRTLETLSGDSSTFYINPNKRDRLGSVLDVPGEMSTLFMDLHLLCLELIELFTNHGLVFWRQSRPRFVGASVVIVSLGDFDVVIETDDFPFLQLLNRRTKTQLPNKHLKKHGKVLQSAGHKGLKPEQRIRVESGSGK